MLIQNLKVSGLLSFGPGGIDLPMRPLNVLIGPNGSGKSNLLEVLALLKAAPTDLSAPIREDGGIGEWLWKGNESTKSGSIEVEVPYKDEALYHGLTLEAFRMQVEVASEFIRKNPLRQRSPGVTLLMSFSDDPDFRQERGNASLQGRDVPTADLSTSQSILSQIKDPLKQPALTSLGRFYSAIRLYRTWTFGPRSPSRTEQSAHLRHDYLDDGCPNLAVVLGAFPIAIKNRISAELGSVYDGIIGLNIATVGGGNVRLFLVEEGDREIPATRLSDGTLRYLSLLAILLHPNPPPLVAIEEPELGLHPDIIPKIAALLVEASQRMQLVVTTHSRMLVDALSDQPESIIVCSKEAGQTKMERLNSDDLKEWLERYTLGDLWSRGEIGGNRW